jgi:hypothetical protein
MTLPQPLVWTNMDAITTVNRSGQPITWSGGGTGNVIIVGGTFNMNTGVGGSFYCTERATALNFTIPSYVLASMPASQVIEGTDTGSLSVMSQSEPVRFTATGIDAGYLFSMYMNSKNVKYQ